ncbi:putative pyridoxal-phosphate dependent enzyme [Zalerion maritima]|uniref:Pyridoxal-phosphate dependent enzyme n=1 Tax=Zalerion maritima TaxID=339359 RepID=A0AAD5RRA9_9PEZI|nr:putative pyridoxal-phosphate dependent enzyme [Zalerion maritima]
MADPSTCPPLTRSSVEAAHELIKPYVHRTPVLTCSTLNLLASTPRTPAERGELGLPPLLEGEKFASPTVRLYFKCENLQKVGAFKARGAFHAVERLKMSPEWEAGAKKNGVVTHSSGNHAAALALAARTNSIPAHIIMPTISPASKIAATRGYGANIIFSGSTAPERESVCKRVQEETGATLVPPYDHPDIVLGQGTMGLELQEQAPELFPGPGGGNGRKKAHLDAIITPCSGGGMLSGVALSCSSPGSDPPTRGRHTRVFGAEPSFQGADDLCRSLRSGARIREVSSLTMADGLRTPVGDVPWYLIRERGLVAMCLVLERMKLVVEPSAAVPLAVILYNEEFRLLAQTEAGPEGGWDIGVVFSGGNCAVERMVDLFAPATAVTSTR